MQCPKCGQELPENAKFCLECGQTILHVVSEPEEAPGENEQVIFNEELTRDEEEKEQSDKLELGLDDDEEPSAGRGRKILIIAGMFILAVALGVGCFLLDHFVLRPDVPTQPSAQPTEQVQVLPSSGQITRHEDEAGNVIYRITMQIQDGSRLTVSAKEFSRDYPVAEGGITTVEIPMSDFVAAIPGKGTQTAEVEVSITRASSEVEKISVGSVELEYPPAMGLEIITPEFKTDQPVTVYTSSVTIRFKADEGISTSVNGDICQPNKYGICSYKANLDYGENTLLFKAAPANGAVETKTVIVNRAKNDFALTVSQVSDPVTNIPEGVKPLVPAGEVTIKGKTEPEAKLVVEPEAKSVKLDETTGEFEIVVVMNEYTTKVFSLTATAGEGMKARVDVPVTYKPDLAYYTAHAQAFTDSLLYSPAAYKQVAFILPGMEVVEIVETEERLVFLAKLQGRDDTVMAFEYTSGVNHLTVGKKVKIFADAYGKYTYGDKTYPHLMARFIYTEQAAE